jgi:hypothetical protein
LSHTKVDVVRGLTLCYISFLTISQRMQCVRGICCVCVPFFSCVYMNQICVANSAHHF